MIQKSCKACGEEFETYPSTDKDYCTQDCYLSNDNPNEEQKLVISCENCGIEFKRIPSVANRGEHNFCSYECTHEWESTNRTGENSPTWDGGRSKLECEYCGDIYKEYREERSKFCSKDCMNNWKRDNWNHPQKGTAKEYFGDNWSQQRQNALERDNNSCEICGDSDLIDVHHIIPRRKFATVEKSNELENLIVLCRSHHMKVEYGDIRCPVPDS